MHKWSQKTELPLCRLVRTAGLGLSKFYNWKDRYGRANEHNAPIPRDFWLEPWEVQAIIRFQGNILWKPQNRWRRWCEWRKYAGPLQIGGTVTNNCPFSVSDVASSGKLRRAGPCVTRPSASKAEPWHGQ
jgi:hypothetical protein